MRKQMSEYTNCYDCKMNKRKYCKGCKHNYPDLFAPKLKEIYILMPNDKTIVPQVVTDDDIVTADGIVIKFREVIDE